MVFVTSFLASILAVGVALYVDRLRLPGLRMFVTEEINEDSAYPSGHAKAGQRWKFSRVAVENSPLAWPLAWIRRQTAVGCKARVDIRLRDSGRQVYSMAGRWVSTPELPHLPSDVRLVTVLHPEPITIPQGQVELLDVIVQAGDDGVAYGWNNEAYGHEWRPEHYRLEPADYIVSVEIATQNGVSHTQQFDLHVAQAVDETALVH